MKALLRFQGVVVARTFASPFVLLLLLAAPVCVWLGAADASFARALYVVTAFAIVFSFAVCGMAITYDALDTVRWSGPLPRGRLFAAHMLFWTGALAAALAPIAALAGASGGVVFAVAMILAVAAAAVMPFVQRRRRGDLSTTVVLLAALGWIMLLSAVGSVVMAWEGNAPLCFVPSGIVLVVFATLGRTALLRDERLPVASGAADVREVAPPRREPRGATAAMRASISPVFIWWWIVFALGSQFAFWAQGWFPFPAMSVVIAVIQLPAFALVPCRWLFATPMDRGRMFRRAFGPIALLVLACVGARLCVTESQPDRAVFFATMRPTGHWGRRDPLFVSQLWEVDEKLQAYRPPDMKFMTARLSDHLWKTYGLDASPARIEASIRRGWPAPPGPALNEWGHDWQEAFFDSMERLQAELADEIVAADRRRNLLIAGVVTLLGLALLQMPPTNVARRLGMIAAMLCVIAMVFLPTLAPNAAASRAVLSWWDAVHRVFQHADPATRWLWLLAWAAAAFALWKSAERSFRRLELTDLPPSPMDALRLTRR